MTDAIADAIGKFQDRLRLRASRSTDGRLTLGEVFDELWWTFPDETVVVEEGWTFNLAEGKAVVVEDAAELGGFYYVLFGSTDSYFMSYNHYRQWIQNT